MQIINLLSGMVISFFCIFLIGLAIMIVIKPRRAEQFLGSYASSARAHYIEQIARLIVGTAMVVLAPFMWYSNLFNLFGWILIVTTIGLLLTPWQWHHKLGERVIPLTLQYMKFYALGAFLLGILVIYSLSRVLVS
ncbi:MAG: hypothetical protein QY332_01880 [Anaerolineales bacterium]|nr:MAG: hypothetical protein QY332_01880 [Anaerolineales bacterium]